MNRVFLLVVLLLTTAAPLWLYGQSSLPLVSYAGSKEPLDIAKLANKSDLIVVAEINRLLDAPGEYFRDEESHRAKLYAAEVTVREVLKGKLSPGKIIVGGLMPITPTNLARGGPLTPNSVRIFFLKPEGNWWKFSDPFFGALVGAPVTPRSAAGPPTEKVMQQLLAALESELLSSEEKRDVISELAGSSDPRILPALKVQLETSRDEMVTFSLLASLILRGDNEAVTDAVKLLTNSTSRHGGILILSIGRLNRADLLPVLVAGLNSPVPSVRAMSASSLVFSPFPQAKTHVLALLDDPNRRLVTQLMVDLSARYKQPDWAPEWDVDKRWKDMRHHWREFLQSTTPVGN